MAGRRGTQQLFDDADAEARIEELLEDNRRMVRVNEELQRELDERYAGTKGVQRGAQRELVRKVRSYPQVQLGICLVVFSWRIWLAARGRLDAVVWKSTGWGGELWSWAFWVTGVIVIWGLWSWSGADFAKSGAGVVFIRLCVVLGGFYGSLAAFSGSIDMGQWMNAEYHAVRALLVMLLSATLSMTNVVPWVVEKFTRSEERLFRTLREWFA
jgi:hypothetical protein